MRVITMAETTKELRSLTMACWWPSRFTGRIYPDWPGILGELDTLVQGAKARMAGYGTASTQEIHKLAGLYNWVQNQIDQAIGK
jgi:hypothetical protein